MVRVSGLQELSEWVGLAGANGADRFELWNKVRGTEQQRAHVAVRTEPFDVAEELLAHVERDGRVETGHAAYAVYAYRGDEKAPSERAFVSMPPRALVTVGSYATPTPAFATGAADPTMGPSLALTNVLSTMHEMIRDMFAAFQRENAHQRSQNESVMRGSMGHFDALAKSYERSFGDMSGRLDAALREANEHRDRRRSAEDELRGLVDKYKEILDLKTSEATEAERRTKATAFAGEQLKLLLPVILAKIAGVPVDAAAIGGAATGGLLDSLTDAQKEVILGALRPEQRIALCEMLQARAQKDPTVTKAAPTSPPTTTTGDVSGSSPAQTPSPMSAPQVPSTASPTSSPTAAPSPGASFTPEEERDLERFTQWLQSPEHQARHEAWLKHKYGQGPATDAPGTPESPSPAANDTDGAAVQTKT
jgi:hypothetical protein